MRVGREKGIHEQNFQIEPMDALDVKAKRSSVLMDCFDRISLYLLSFPEGAVRPMRFLRW